MVAQPVPSPEDQASLRNYNYEHFRTRHFVADLVKTIHGEGVTPGHQAPDFDIETTTGERIRLSALSGRPVVLHFGSLT